MPQSIELEGAGGTAPRPPRRLRLPVRCSIITGSLAAGKTTFIAGLLQSKPPEEVWAVLVNEFGAAGLDAALLAGGAAGLPTSLGGGAAAAAAAGAPAAAAAAPAGGVHIKQLAGGCLCCALSSMTPLAIAQLLRTAKPDRLLIEPSGLAHPAALLDMLQGNHLGGSLALQHVVCLVDATQFAGGAASPPACEASQLLMDQISIADVLVGSKADLCSPAALDAFRSWAGQLFPPKALVRTAAAGRLVGEAEAAALLAWPAGEGASADVARYRSSSSAGSSRAGGGGAAAQQAPAGQQQQQQAQQAALPVPRVRRTPAGTPWLTSSAAAAAAAEAGAQDGEGASSAGQPLRKQVQDGSGAYAACGWIFHRDCVFSRPRLLALLQALVPRVLRLKGVFRLSPTRWEAVSAAPPPVAASSSSSGAAEPPGGAAEPAAALGSALASASASASARAAEAEVELREIAYRRDSRVEMILHTAAAAAAAAAMAGPAAAAAAAAAVTHAEGRAVSSGSSSGGGGDEGRLAAQAAGLSLEGQAGSGGGGEGGGGNTDGLEHRVLGALGRAAEGDWAGIEALLLGILQEGQPS